MVISHGSNKHEEKKAMKVYFFADLICIYFATLGCREEKNGKKKEQPKKHQPVFLTLKNSPQSFFPTHNQ